jgi:hypothetical protein
MKKLLLVLCVVIPSLVQAQNTNLKIWEAQYSEFREWNADSAKYLLSGGGWQKTKFAYTKEFIAMELKEDKVTKIWWAYYNSPNDYTDCYYTENDAFKICINTKEKKVNLWSDAVGDRLTTVWTLSKIHQVKR